MYAAAGIVGAIAGSTFGKMVDGDKLLFLFALVMLVVGALMLKGRGNPGDPGVECNREKAPKVVAYGLGSGAFSGFFGIGGGFLIVPGLVASTGMPMLMAVGTSLVAVTAFGLSTGCWRSFSSRAALQAASPGRAPPSGWAKRPAVSPSSLQASSSSSPSTCSGKVRPSCCRA
jgi:uncharacterized membrane protein YfcA